MDCARVVDIQLLNVEERMFDIIINYSQTFRDGRKKVCRRNVKHLGTYYEGWKPKSIVAAECLGKVYCGVLRNDPRLLFIIKLRDGSVQLIHAREGSSDSLKLLELS